MVDESKGVIPANYEFIEKWDSFLDLGLRRLAYFSLAGAVTGRFLFRSPATRWASVAFGAGLGIGSAYSECSHTLDGSSPKLTPDVSPTPISKVEE
ncbi:hypothetical protein ACS0TY_036159 [Phlomoides rotata]